MTDRDIDLMRTAAIGDPTTEEGRRALVEIFQLYFDNVSATCAEMRQDDGPEQLRAHAHRAKGASGVVGALGMSAVFADVEAMAAAGETLSVEMHDDIERQLADLKRVLSAKLGVEFQ